MLQLFGLTVPSSATLDREVATALAGRITAAATAVRNGAPAALSAELRRDARRYLDARRQGGLRFAGTTGRACDEGAHALLRLTLDAPPIRMEERLVA